MESTFFDHRHGQAKQLDRFFMHQGQRGMAKSCRAVSMLVNSDHEAVLLTLTMRKAAAATRTQRQLAGSRAIAGAFGRLAGKKERKAATKDIAKK